MKSKICQKGGTFMISYYELQQFVAFYYSGTLSAVAEQFHISQPTLTRNMQKIESLFGVPLFLRTKNHIALNESGLFAAKQAELLVHQTHEMFQRVRDFDKAQHTIAIGSCAPMPIQPLIHRISSVYPDITISSEIKGNHILLEKLEKDEYQLIILPTNPKNPSLFCQRIGEEHLMFCLPLSHPFAGRKNLRLADLNGNAILILNNLGFWSDIIKEKMPDSHLLVQRELYSFGELIKNSLLPCFSTDLTIKTFGIPENRVSIPITDAEVNVIYYLICKKENLKKFDVLFSQI